MEGSRHTLGLVDCVKVSYNSKSDKALARIDTGAAKCSIDIEFAKKIDLVSKGKIAKIRSANGRSSRELVHCTFHIGGKMLDAEATLADRSHMRYKILIGQNLLKAGKFIVDPLIDGNKRECR